MEDIISKTLRVGVFLSIITILSGLIFHIVFKLPIGQSIIKLGLYILFLTPFARLVISLVLFFVEKDRIYFFITLAIIVIIVLSNLLSKATI